jgi:hypothetical protein
MNIAMYPTNKSNNKRINHCKTPLYKQTRDNFGARDHFSSGCWNGDVIIISQWLAKCLP